MRYLADIFRVASFFMLALIVVGQASSVKAAEPAAADLRSVQLRFVGGEKAVPLAGCELLVTQGYGSQEKRFGPFRLDDAGMCEVRLPIGFYHLHLKSEKESPFLPVEQVYKGRERRSRPGMNLSVKASHIEKWLDGERREDGVERNATPRITYTLLSATEFHLRAVDESGKGIAGITFYTENAVGEDWAHDIENETIGPNRPRAEEQATDASGNFRRFIGANQGYKYGVELIPAGYEQVSPKHEVEINVVFGQPRAEQVFKFRRKK